jgi:predicted ATPase
MIERVRVRGYKSLRDVEIRLHPLTVILGPNAAGKTNLFDALGLLARVVSGKTIKDAFDARDHRGAPLEAFYLGDSTGGIPSDDVAQFSVEVDVRLSPDVLQDVQAQIVEMRKGLTDTAPRRRVVEERLRYSITLEMVLASGYLRVRDEKLLALNADGTPRASRVPFLEQVSGRLRLRMEGQARPTEHEIGLDYALVSAPLYPPHYPHITAFREELSRWRFFYLEPRQMRAEVPLQEVRSIASDGSGLAAFFNTLKVTDEAQFKATQKALHALVPPIQGLDVDRTPQGFLRLVITEEGVPFSSRVISEGTIRILGLLAITSGASPVAVIGYEEPENGVHHHRLSLIARLMETAADQGKQILINTHSPRLAQLLPGAALIFCQRAGHESRFVEYGEGPLFREQAAEDAIAQDSETSLEERIARGDLGG